MRQKFDKIIVVKPAYLPIKDALYITDSILSCGQKAGSSFCYFFHFFGQISRDGKKIILHTYKAPFPTLNDLKSNKDNYLNMINFKCHLYLIRLL